MMQKTKKYWNRFPMNTNKTGFLDGFQRFCVLVLWTKVASALEGSNMIIQTLPALNYQWPVNIQVFSFNKNLFYTRLTYTDTFSTVFSSNSTVNPWIITLIKFHMQYIQSLYVSCLDVCKISLLYLQIIHPSTDDYFEGWDGAQYLPRPALKSLYPHD